MKRRNPNAIATKKDLIEFAERVIAGIQEYTEQRKKRDKNPPPRV